MENYHVPNFLELRDYIIDIFRQLFPSIESNVYYEKEKKKNKFQEYLYFDKEYKHINKHINVYDIFYGINKQNIFKYL